MLKKIFSLFLVMVLCACLPEADSNDLTERERLVAAREKALEKVNKPVRVNIGDRAFDIPLKYIIGKGRPPKNYKHNDDGDLFIKIVMPDFTSKQDFVTKEEYDQAFKTQRFGGLYIGDTKQKVSMPELVRLRKKSASKIEALDAQYGLESFNKYYPSPKGEYLYSTLHVEKDASGQIIGLIECASYSKERLAKWPTCNHTLIDNGLWYYFFYNKKNYFQNWENIKQQAIDFVNGFEVHDAYSSEDQ